MTRRVALALIGVGASVLTACGTTTSGTPSPLVPTLSTPASSSSTHPSAPTSTTPGASHSSAHPPTSSAQAALAAMTEAQRVGQLIMVDCPSTFVSAATLDDIRQYHVGSVILDGTSGLSVGQTAAITARLQGSAPTGVRLFIATDQEGGIVQRLRGQGFSAIPSAITQGSTSPTTLRAEATSWGGQLRRAGVNVDLAPVLDTVPAGWGSNPPIGDLDREYGRSPATVAAHGVAVARGLADAGIDATAKHFPGLGRTRGNTDVSSGVTDTITTRHDAYLAPFTAAVAAGVPFVMISTAIYTRIDPNRPAAFSPTVIAGMLRGDLGFGGVVISDDIGVAKQLSGYSIGGRAVAFVEAGGDIALTVDASQAATMTAALLARTGSDAAFKAKVDAAVLTILQAKQARGLLG